MFEFFRYDRREARQRAGHGRHLPTGQKSIARKSFLFWGEHCVECAAPACYSSCSLYEPRADGRCRRFEYGIYENTRRGRAARRRACIQAVGAARQSRQSQAGTGRESLATGKVGSSPRSRCRSRGPATGPRHPRRPVPGILAAAARTVHAFRCIGARPAASGPTAFSSRSTTPPPKPYVFNCGSVRRPTGPLLAPQLIQIRPTFQTWLEAAPGTRDTSSTTSCFATLPSASRSISA